VGFPDRLEPKIVIYAAVRQDDAPGQLNLERRVVELSAGEPSRSIFRINGGKAMGNAEEAAMASDKGISGALA